MGLQVLEYGGFSVEVAVLGGGDECLWLPFDASDTAETLPMHAVEGGHDDDGR